MRDLTRSLESNHRSPLWVLFATGIVWLISSCSTTEVITASATPPIQLQNFQSGAPRLDVTVIPLDPNLAALANANDGEIPVTAEVRRAESRYIAFQLKETLQQTGNWGIVRMVPTATQHHELVITGKILESDGEQLSVSITATDATGETWLTKIYEDTASKYAYKTEAEELLREDPFQSLYNAVADDLILYYQEVGQTQINSVKLTADIAFAANLAPDAFGAYLQTDSQGKVRILQVPADNDTVRQKIDRIRNQDDLLVDTFDDYYFNFHKDVAPSYYEWRYATYDEAVMLRKGKKEALDRKLKGVGLVGLALLAGAKSDTYAGDIASVAVAGGGVKMIKSGFDRAAQTEIHDRALEELTQSLSREVAPSVFDIEGRAIELTGSAEQQYEQWRQMLRQLYESDRGIPQSPTNL